MSSDKVRFRCQCGQELSAAKSAAGAKVVCPKCSTTLLVPGAAATPAASATDVIKIRCPCGQVLAAKKSAAGSTVACPKCQQHLRVPGSAQPAPSQPAPSQPAPSQPAPSQPAPSQQESPDAFGDGGFPSFSEPPAAAFSAPQPAAQTPVNNPYTAAAANPYSPPSGGGMAGPVAAGNNDAERTRNQYLSHEASMKGIGLLYLLGSVLLLFMGVLTLIGGIATLAAGGKNPEAGVIIMVLSVFYLGFGALQLFVGRGLRRMQEWARITAGVLTIPGLLGIPIGTLVSAYFLYIFFSEKGKYVCSDHYRQVVAATPHIKYKTHPAVWAVLIVLVLVIVFGIIALVFTGS
ncbi:hypothetical protein CA13_08190 [Planctomycetes bacterium CA13]|uniref:Double zinc ribbon n=1 Tax=Novipirellula herctigrandis TaxID=2527986 RepID=A0A5C5YWH2_9BACT|nr:hypothetical protein CA13_08190 [Planctomycetes bacterium CA13]